MLLGYYGYSATITTQRHHSYLASEIEPIEKPSTIDPIIPAVNVSSLPQWAQTYFAWHAAQRPVLSPISNHRYLIYTCLQTDASCGGLSDRIKSLPYFLLMAAKTQRVFLVYWNRPCRLEEFLLPPEGGLDWRTPDWLVRTFLDDRSIPLATTHTSITHYTHNKNQSIVMVRLQDQHGGSDFYNQQQSAIEGRRAFRRSFRRLFYHCFVPNPTLGRAIRDTMARLQLQSNQYVGAHFRAKYNERHPFSDHTVQTLTRNMIQCAIQLQPSDTSSKAASSMPIYFATDSLLAMQSLQNGHEQWHRPIVWLPQDAKAQEPLHLDKASSNVCSDYYGVFIDLFVLSHARCIAHAQGGYGRLAVLLSQNASCFHSMITGGRIVQCQ